MSDNIKGCVNWQAVPWVQHSNDADLVLKKRGLPGWKWTETCGPTSLVNALDSVNKLPVITAPGGYTPRPADVLMDWFNDPANDAQLKAIRSDVDPDTTLNNEVPQFHPLGVLQVFGVNTAVFNWGGDFNTLANLVSEGNAVVICLKNPGHYLALVAYDLDTKELIYKDPFPERFNDNLGGIRRMAQAEFDSNVEAWYCTIS